MNGILAAGYFIFSLIFGVVTFTLWLRFALRYLRISAMHPISQVVFKLTNNFVQPFSNILKYTPIANARLDWACFILIVLIEIIKFLLIGYFFFSTMLPVKLLILYPIADLIVQPLDVFFYAVFIRVIMSWINPAWRNPLSDLLIILTEPILSKVRRFTPPIAGFDFSPFIILISIKVITVFISASLPFHLI